MTIEVQLEGSGKAYIPLEDLGKHIKVRYSTDDGRNSEYSLNEIVARITQQIDRLHMILDVADVYPNLPNKTTWHKETK